MTELCGTSRNRYLFMVTANVVSKDKHGILIALLGQTSEQKKGTAVPVDG